MFSGAILISIYFSDVSLTVRDNFLGLDADAVKTGYVDFLSEGNTLTKSLLTTQQEIN